jgi:hypothetical protein
MKYMIKQTKTIKSMTSAEWICFCTTMFQNYQNAPSPNEHRHGIDTESRFLPKEHLQSLYPPKGFRDVTKDLQIAMINKTILRVLKPNSR